MSSETLIKYKAAKCGELLAKSVLPEEFKKAIVDNIAKASEKDLDNLLESLEKEQLEFERLEKGFNEIEKEENEDWNKLQKRQEDLAQKMADDFLAEVIKSKI